MDAIMLALVAVLLANADGRAGLFLSRLLSARADRRRVVVIAFAVFIANAAVAAIAGSVANRMIGQGVVALLVAFALLAAAAALLWHGRPVMADGRIAEASPAGLAVHMLLDQFGDRSHFLIGALAATSGAGQWAAAGGFIGWTLAMLPFLAFGPALAARRAAPILRFASVAILALWGIRTAMAAFGLIAMPR
jgi:putative Ca2+/H+ antiporter (TMEM165/GDT1 family)